MPHRIKAQHAFSNSSHPRQHGAMLTYEEQNHLPHRNSSWKTTQTRKAKSPTNKTWDGTTLATPILIKNKNKTNQTKKS